MLERAQKYFTDTDAQSKQFANDCSIKVNTHWSHLPLLQIPNSSPRDAFVHVIYGKHKPKLTKS